MDAPIIRVELQRSTSDCVIAVLAMLLGYSYEEVLVAASPITPNILECGAYSKEIKRIAKRLGFKTKVKRAYLVDVGEDVGALSIESPHWKQSHLVVLKAGLIVDTDGSIWDADVYLKVNKAKAMSLLEFFPAH